jgi:hypothetical protein
MMPFSTGSSVHSGLGLLSSSTGSNCDAAGGDAAASLAAAMAAVEGGLATGHCTHEDQGAAAAGAARGRPAAEPAGDLGTGGSPCGSSGQCHGKDSSSSSAAAATATGLEAFGPEVRVAPCPCSVVGEASLPWLDACAALKAGTRSLAGLYTHRVYRPFAVRTVGRGGCCLLQCLPGRSSVTAGEHCAGTLTLVFIRTVHSRAPTHSGARHAGWAGPAPPGVCCGRWLARHGAPPPGPAHQPAAGGGQRQDTWADGVRSPCCRCPLQQP